MKKASKPSDSYYERQRQLGRGIADEAMTPSEWAKARGYDLKKKRYSE